MSLSGNIDLARRTYALIDSYFPCEATICGVHTFDKELESFNAARCRDMKNSLLTLSGEFSKNIHARLPLQEKIELVLTLKKIREILRFLDIDRNWEWDPFLYLLPFATAIYYMVKLDYAPLEERAYCILQRIRLLPQFLHEARNNLKPQSYTHVKGAIPIAYGVKMYLEETIHLLKSKVPVIAAELEATGKEALYSLAQFREFLMNELLIHSASTSSSDSTLFKKISEQCLHPYTAEELWTIACEELDYAEELLIKYAKKISGDSEWKNLLRKFARMHPTVKTLKNFYRNSIETAREFTSMSIADVKGKRSVRIEDTPYFLRIQFPTVSYAASGGMDDIQETLFCITPIITGYSDKSELLQLREHNFGRIQFIPIHEAYPGHNLHFEYASENPSDIIRRTRSSITSEGWAIYCENQAMELSYLNPEGVISKLEADIWRASRMWIEVGLNTGKVRYNDAYDLLTKRVGASDEVAQAEIAKSQVNSGEASGYCIGRREIQALREEFGRKYPSLSVREFHQQFMHAGCIPPILISFILRLRPEEDLDRLWQELCSGV